MTSEAEMERYEALAADTRAAMENRFMWAVSTGPSHPEATVEKAVATIVDPLLDEAQRDRLPNSLTNRQLLERIMSDLNELIDKRGNVLLIPTLVEIKGLHDEVLLLERLIRSMDSRS